LPSCALTANLASHPAMSSTWTVCAAVAGLTAVVAIHQKRSVTAGRTHGADGDSDFERSLMNRKVSSQSECYESTVCPSEHFDLGVDDLDEEEWTSSTGATAEFFFLEDDDELDPYELDDATWAAFSLPGKCGCSVGLLPQ